MSDVRNGSLNELWWLGVWQGIAALFFGIAAIFWPGLTQVTLVYLFSAFVLVWGLVEVVRGFMSVGRNSTWWLTLVFGLFSLGVGVYLVRHTDVTFDTFVLLIGFTLIVRGIFDVVATFLEETSTTAKTLWGIAGLGAVVVGIVVLRQSAADGVNFVWLLGLYALAYGPLAISTAFDMRSEWLGGGTATSRRR